MSLPKIGILGGGQLGLMFAQNALNYNFFIKILDPDANAPCKNIAGEFVCGKLTDKNTVAEFGKDCDVITVEIENVSVEGLVELQKLGKKVFPKPEHLALIQDKRLQKQFYAEQNIPTVEFLLIENREDLRQKAPLLGFPCVQKLGREGYDGRGVMKLFSEKDCETGFEKPSLIEKFADIKKELSVIAARNESGEIRTFPCVEVVYHPEHNLTDYLIAPADIKDAEEKAAEELALLTVKKLDFVGLLAVEMFLTHSGEILVNEIAPRPHNSGHQSIEGNIGSQFEQHLRAVCNLPLADTSLRGCSAMLNLLGEPGFEGEAVYEGLENVLAIPAVFVHLYGKKMTKPFRKMGHVTVLGKNRKETEEKIELVKKYLKVKSL